MRSRKAIINNENELFEIIEKGLADPYNSKKKLWQVMWELGIKDTVQITDHRTMQIIENYKFYKSNPRMAFDNEVWFQSVILLQSIEPRLI